MRWISLVQFGCVLLFFHRDLAMTFLNQFSRDFVGAAFFPVALLVSMASSVVAAPVLVINGGFEDISGEDDFNEFTFGPLSGWDLYDPGFITSGGAGSTYYIGTLTPNPPTNFTAGAAEGQRVGIGFNFVGSGNQGEYGFQQTLAATLQANTRYNLDVEIGNIASGTAVNNQFFDLNGFPGYRVDVMAGGVLVAQDNNSLAGLIAEGTFGTSSIEFTIGAAHAQLGQALQIRLVNLNQIDPMFPGANLEVDFDDVRLRAVAVPEPSSAALVGLSAIAALVLRRRKTGRIAGQ